MYNLCTIMKGGIGLDNLSGISFDNNIATVDDNGIATPIDNGVVKITAYNQNGCMDFYLVINN